MLVSGTGRTAFLLLTCWWWVGEELCSEAECRCSLKGNYPTSWKVSQGNDTVDGFNIQINGPTGRPSWDSADTSMYHYYWGKQLQVHFLPSWCHKQARNLCSRSPLWGCKGIQAAWYEKLENKHTTGPLKGLPRTQGSVWRCSRTTPSKVGNWNTNTNICLAASKVLWLEFWS